MAEAGHEAKRAPDLGMYGGLLLGFGSHGYGFFLEGGDFGALLLPSPIIIIFGGTAATLWMCIPGQNPLTWGGFFRAGFTDTHHDGVATIQTFVRLAEKARREGLLSLESEMGNIHDPFMKEGIQEVVDGTPAEQITDIFMVRIDQMSKRHHVGKEFYGQGGAFASTGSPRIDTRLASGNTSAGAIVSRMDWGNIAGIAAVTGIGAGATRRAVDV